MNCAADFRRPRPKGASICSRGTTRRRVACTNYVLRTGIVDGNRRRIHATPMHRMPSAVHSRRPQTHLLGNVSTQAQPPMLYRAADGEQRRENARRCYAAHREQMRENTRRYRERIALQRVLDAAVAEGHYLRHVDPQTGMVRYSLASPPAPEAVQLPSWLA